MTLAVFWPALTWVILWTECRSWALRSRDLERYQGLLIERIRIESEAGTVGKKIASLCLPEARACDLPAEELYQALDALSRVDRRHAIYEQLADLYCRTRCNVSKKKRALDQRYAELLTDPPTDAFAYGGPPEPLQAIFYLLLRYQSPKWTLQLDQQHLMRVLLQPAADGSAAQPLHTPASLTTRCREGIKSGKCSCPPHSRNPSASSRKALSKSPCARCWTSPARRWRDPAGWWDLRNARTGKQAAIGFYILQRPRAERFCSSISLPSALLRFRTRSCRTISRSSVGRRLHANRPLGNGDGGRGASIMCASL